MEQKDSDIEATDYRSRLRNPWFRAQCMSSHDSKNLQMGNNMGKGASIGRKMRSNRKVENVAMMWYQQAMQVW